MDIKLRIKLKSSKDGDSYIVLTPFDTSDENLINFYNQLDQDGVSILRYGRNDSYKKIRKLKNFKKTKHFILINNQISIMIPYLAREEILDYIDQVGEDESIIKYPETSMFYISPNEFYYSNLIDEMQDAYEKRIRNKYDLSKSAQDIEICLDGNTWMGIEEFTSLVRMTHPYKEITPDMDYMQEQFGYYFITYDFEICENHRIVINFLVYENEKILSSIEI